VSGTDLLFDQPYYLRINEARWDVASWTLDDLRRAGLALTSCLDVGCGPGWFAERLVAAGLQVEGIDGRRELIDEARRRVPSAVFHVSNIESDRPLGNSEPFDLVFCFGLLYHTENPFKVLRNLYALTAKVLLLESMVLPGDDPIYLLHAEGANETQGLTYHALLPTRTALVKMLQVAGFRHVLELSAQVPHEDFAETQERHRRRTILLGSRVPLSLANWISLPDIQTPKYNHAKRPYPSALP
jgi:SAM-dependent methyltransferase